jgi:hypothetical protein
MVVIHVRLRERGGVDDIVIGRVGQHLIDSLESVGEDLSCLFILERFHVLETGMVGFRKNPGFKWKSGGKGSKGEKGFVFSDDTGSLLEFLPDDITVDTSIFIIKIGFSSFNLFTHSLRDDGKGDNLRMGMFQRGSRRDPMIFKDEDVSKTLVTP